jgi:hypothetical protein
MRLRTFTSEVEVAGLMRRVQWDGETLTIFSVETYEDALKLLSIDRGYPADWDAQEAPAKLVAPEPASATRPNITTGAALPYDMPQDFKSQNERAQAATERARAEAKERAAASLAARKASDLAAVTPAGPSDDIPFGGDEKPGAVCVVSEAAVDDPEAAGDPEDVKTAFLTGLVASKSIRDLIKHFFDNGLTDRNEIVAICKQHKKVVPALQRVSNIDDRLGRALEALEAS